MECQFNVLFLFLSRNIFEYMQLNKYVCYWLLCYFYSYITESFKTKFLILRDCIIENIQSKIDVYAFGKNLKYRLSVKMS